MASTIIINSEIDSGKTSFLKKLLGPVASRGLRVSGFLAHKKISCGKRSYYLELIGRKGRIKAVEVGSSGPKAFPEAFKKTEKAVLAAAGASDVVIIDEVGPLELSGKGHCRLVKKLLRKFPGTLVITVRKELLKEAVSFFRLRRPGILKKLSVREFMSETGL